MIFLKVTWRARRNILDISRGVDSIVLITISSNIFSILHLLKIFIKIIGLLLAVISTKGLTLMLLVAYLANTK